MTDVKDHQDCLGDRQMSHDMKELQRQYDEARSRYSDTHRKLEEAKRRLIDAKIAEADAEFASRGILPGSVVIGRSGTKTTERGIFVGHQEDRYSLFPRPVIRKIKKDGTAHATAEVRSWYFDTKWELAE